MRDKNLRQDSRRFPKPTLPTHTLGHNGLKWCCKECGTCYMTAKTQFQATQVHAMHLAEVKLYRENPDRESNLRPD
jgi:hypothetical protein